MKCFSAWVLIGSVLSFNLFAGESSSRAKIYTRRPMSCDSKSSGVVINSISDLSLTEDSEVVRVSFRTRVGICDGRSLNPELLSQYQRVVFLEENRLNLPWQNAPISRVGLSRDGLSALVEVIFEKDSLFADSNQAQFKCLFYPRFREKEHPSAGSHFLWFLSLEYSPEERLTSLKVTD